MDINHEKFITLEPGDAAVVIRNEGEGEIQIHLIQSEPPEIMASRAHKMAAMLLWAAHDTRTAIRFTKDVNAFQEITNKQN